MESQQINAELIEKFIESYKACGLDKTREYDFFLSIVASKKMPVRGGLDWLTSIVSRGLPETYVKLGNELIEYAEKSHRKDVASTLHDFAKKLKTGYPLTTRQQAYVEILKRQVLEAKPDIQLDSRQLMLFQFFVQSFQNNQRYWSGRPGSSARIEKIFRRYSADSCALSQDDWEYLRNNFKGITESYENTSVKHPVGSLRWYLLSPITILSDSKISKNYKGVVVDVLHTKLGVIEIMVSNIKIRGPAKT